MGFENLFSTIDELEKEYCKFTEDICNIESPTDYKKGVDEGGEYIIKKALEKGWKIEVLEQDVAGNAICITMNPDADKKPIAISGHMDTVHPLGFFGKPAVKVDEEKIYGPGTLDCKGGIAAGFMAMDALQRCGFTSRPVQLLLQSDEETSSKTSNKATINYICEKAKDSVAFLNMEGRGDANIGTLVRKGILRYNFNVHGKAAHSAWCVGAANAVTEAAHKIIELEKMKDGEGLTCNCGVISGGTKANSVADFCTFTADIRFSTAEEMEKAKEICKKVAQTTYVPGCSCELEEMSTRPAMELCDKNVELFETMNKIYEKVGLPPLIMNKAAGGSDTAYTTAYGIPSIDSIAVSGGGGHSINEYITIKSLSESAKRVAAVVWYI